MFHSKFGLALIATMSTCHALKRTIHVESSCGVSPIRGDYTLVGADGTTPTKLRGKILASETFRANEGRAAYVRQTTERKNLGGHFTMQTTTFYRILQRKNRKWVIEY